jgi:hypothetical protein
LFFQRSLSYRYINEEVNIINVSLIPQIKKDVESFLLEEKGEISKHKIISFGALLSGLAALNIVTKIVAGQQISALHDHCDPGHKSGTGGWSGLSNRHSSANGVPQGHCSSTGHGSSGHGSSNAAHGSNIVFNYG